MQDIKLIHNGKYWTLDFENGDLAKTDSLDTAVYMSVLCEKRADVKKVANPLLRRGHFSSIFYNYEVGSFLWFYAYQTNITSEVLESIKKAVSDGLKWFIDDKIMTKTKITTAQKKDSGIDIGIELFGKKDDSKYYNLFVNL
jgi:phage gp46-like protein